MFVSIRGGAYSRAGTLYCGMAKQPAFPGSTDPRLIPFQFRTNQGYILEFGDHYVRFITNGGYITESPLAISAAAIGIPLSITVPGHSFVVDDWIFITGATGMTEIDGLTFIILSVVGDVLTLADTFGVPVNALNFGAYTGGGTAARIYTVTTPYAASDLPYLKYAQSADLMSLTLSNPVAGTEYPPQDLDRLAANSWTLTPTNFASPIAAPASCTAVPSTTIGGALASGNNQPAAQYAYCVTAVDVHGNESQASPVAYTPNDTNAHSSVDISLTAGSVTVTWSPVAGAVAYNVYKAPAAVWNTGSVGTQPPQNVPIGSSFGFAGSAVGNQWIDQNVVQDFTTTPPLHENPFAPGQILSVTPGAGGAGYVQSTTTASVTSATGSGAVIIPVVVNGAVTAFIVQNAGRKYKPGDTLVITDSSGGTGAGGTLVIGPQTGTYPGVVTYFQQRRGYADTLNNPDTYYFSQPGSFTNMDAADPPIPSDAITGTPWAQQVNGIQWMIAMTSGLVVGTGLGSWLLTGGGGVGTPVEPASQNANSQEINGFSPTVPPIKINYELLFPQALGNRVRAAVFNFWNNTYTSEDLTVISNHLFDGHEIVQWAWAQEPYKLIWIVRDDGVLLSLTYLKDQQLIGWARHDTQGQVVSIAVASEPPVDAVYIMVKRFIPGKNAYGYYVERMDNRLWQNGAETCWCVDAGLSLTLATPNAALVATAAGPVNTSAVFAASAPVFDGVTTGVPGQVIRIGGGKATVTAFLSTVQVQATITVPITALTPEIAANLTQIPLPAAPGAWSIATPVSTLSGLNHLEGLTVTGLADGAVIPPTPVTNGSITLPFKASAVVVGLPFQAQGQTLHLQKAGEEIQDQRKRIVGVTVRVEQSRGVKLGANQPNASAQEGGANVPWGNNPYGRMILIPETQNLLGPNQGLPLFTGDHYIPIDDDWNMIGQSAPPGMVAFQQDFPLPMNVLAVIPKFATGDTPVP